MAGRVVSGEDLEQPRRGPGGGSTDQARPVPVGTRRADAIPSRRSLVVVVVGICMLVVAVVGAGLWHDRTRRLEAAHREATTLAYVLQEQTASMLQAADLALLGVAEAMRREPGLPEHDPAFENSLRRLTGHVPAVRALFVIGTDGFIVQDSDRDTPRRNLADRDYFKAHIQGPDRGLFIGRPAVSRSVNHWFIGLSRRVETPEGAFAGVAAAAVDVRYFEGFYQDLGLEAGDVITLATPDGLLVARQPRADTRIGQPLAPGDDHGLLVRGLARAGSGSFQTASGIDGRTRIFGYHAIDGQPLVVLVGLSQERVLASWWRGVVAATVATVFSVALAALSLWLAVRYGRREAAAQARLAEAAKLEALGRLTGGVAHDFGNLLQVMSSALRLLGNRSSEDARAREVVKQGVAALERGKSQVARLLGIARPQEMRVQEVDINALLTSMETLLRSAAAPKARIELALAADLQRCRADPAHLDAAILNLVVNARDALPPGRPGQGVIRISTRNCDEAAMSCDGHWLDPGRFVCVTVRDDDLGMTPEVRRRALEPFFTTKGEHGTGIGLAQVHGFVRELGGHMQIESEISVGTAVHLYLPRA